MGEEQKSQGSAGPPSEREQEADVAMKRAFHGLERTPLMNAMKVAGEYERLLRKLALSPPTRVSRVSREGRNRL